MNKEELKTWPKKKLIEEYTTWKHFIEEGGSYSTKDFIWEEWLVEELHRREVE